MARLDCGRMATWSRGDGRLQGGKGLSTSSTAAIIKRPLGTLRVLPEQSLCSVKQLVLLKLSAVSTNWTPFQQVRKTSE